MYIIMSSTELSRSMTSILLSVQSGSIPTDQGQGYGQLRPSQVTVSEISSAQRSRSASHSFVYAQFSTMALGQEIIPIGEAATALYDDTSMNGSNGPASPIVVEPGDREGPIEEMPECAFYMYAPQFHWTLAVGVAEDRPARSAIENIAHEQYRFGTQAEECHRRLIAGQVEAKRRIVELEAQVAKLQDELAVLQAKDTSTAATLQRIPWQDGGVVSAAIAAG